MTKPANDKSPVQSVVEDNHRKTMKVVNAIQSNTETLLRTTERMAVHMFETGEDRAPDPSKGAEQGTGIAEQITGPTVAPAPSVTDALAPTHDPLPEKPAPPLPPVQMAEIIKICVAEVMETVNPVLNSLNKFIQANSNPAPQEPSDDGFAEQLIEEMKLSLGRRQRIAMAKNRLTKP